MSGRDRQRARLYAWEDATVAPRDQSLLAFAQAQGMVDAIWSETGLRYSPKVERLPRQATTRRADASRLILRPPERLPSWILLHELAHAVTSSHDGASDGHGSVFVGLYVNLMVRYLRFERHKLLRSRALLKSPASSSSHKHRRWRLLGGRGVGALPWLGSGPMESDTDLDSEWDIMPRVHHAHFLQSTLRERIVEHVFIGDALRRLWQRRVTNVEVLRSEFDAGGYDLVMSHRKIVRHIQFKTAVVGSKGSAIKANLKLSEKPSGCVLCILVTTELELQSYLWFGGSPGQPLPDITTMKVAKHAKANSQGIKAARPDHRLIPRRQFRRLGSIDEVLNHLFDSLPPFGSLP